MELHSRVFKVALASAIGLFAVIGAQEESAASQYRYLCTSITSACEYAPPTAPILREDVCWEPTSAKAYLMPQEGCAAGQWGYYVESGEVVDPVTNEVAAYVPLDDACDMGYCVVKPPNTGPTEATPLCCDNDSSDGDTGCVAVEGTCPSGSVSLWCAEGEAPAQQGGEWDCYEE